MSHLLTLAAVLIALMREPAQKSATAKQLLVVMRDRGHLNDRQLRALGLRLDTLVKLWGEDVRGDDPMAVLSQVLGEYDSGELKLDDGKAASSMRPPGVFDCPEGESPKQVLMWLRERGTLSQQEVQRAAQAMNAAEGVSTWSRDDVARLLYEQKLFNALPVDWTPDAPEVEEQEAQNDAWEQTRTKINWQGLVSVLERKGRVVVPVDVAAAWDEGVFVAVGEWMERGFSSDTRPPVLDQYVVKPAETPPPPPPADPTAPAKAMAEAVERILALRVPEVREALNQLDWPELLHAARAAEEAGQNRKGVKDAIEERLGELELAASLDG